MQVIRIIVSVFLAVEMAVGSLFTGSIPKKAEMPAMKTGEYTRYVNPFIGTGGIPWVSAMLSPAATVPFGCVRLGPDTCVAGGIFLFKTNTSGYYYEHRHLRGFSFGRLSGTGIYDYGMFRVTPFLGSKKPASLAFSHRDEEASPGYYAVYLPTAAAMAEMTATAHTGYQRFTFSTQKDAKLYVDAASFIGDSNVQEAVINVDEANRVITGKANINGGFSSRFGGMWVYFYGEFDAPLAACEKDGDTGVVLNFGNVKDKPVTLRAGISFVSEENAKENLIAEAGSDDFDTVRQKADEVWNGELGKIRTDADEETKQIFYTSLYHTMIMPTDFTDEDGSYVGFDKEVHTAEGYTYRTDMSLWDTARDVNALYCLIEKEVQSDCLQSLMNMAEQGGVLPRWPMGEGYTGSMLGNPANLVFTESYLKGFDMDAEKVLEYMRKSTETSDAREVRELADLYEEYGYVPEDLARERGRSISVSRTVEYSWADAAVAVLAEALGKDDVAAAYKERAARYKNVWNPETKYFQARNADGSWGVLRPNMTAFYDDILGFRYSKAYCEGSARQWRWGAIHDVDGMIELFGSEEYFVSELEEFMKDASLSRAALNPGAGYWPGNQHDLHTPYLFVNANRPDLTQKWVRWTLNNRFSTDVDGLDGNDDGGTLSAWYVFSALGFYPVAGSDNYWVGSPCINSAQLDLGGGKTLTVTVNNQGSKNIYVKSVTLNGKPLTDFTFTHDMIAEGGEMVFTMSDKA